MNAAGNYMYILASYISLFGPFVPHALRGAVTKCRFNTPLSLDLVYSCTAVVELLRVSITCRITVLAL